MECMYVSFDGENCVDIFMKSDKFNVFISNIIATILIVVLFMIPVIMMIVFYAKVIMTLIQRQTTMPSSPIIQRATKDITHSALVISILFFLIVLFELFVTVTFSTNITEAGLSLTVLDLIDSTLYVIIFTGKSLVYVMSLPSYRLKFLPSFFGGVNH